MHKATRAVRYFVRCVLVGVRHARVVTPYTQLVIWWVPASWDIILVSRFLVSSQQTFKVRGKVLFLKSVNNQIYFIMRISLIQPTITATQISPPQRLKLHIS